MKNATKIITSLLLIIIFLLACGAMLSIGFVGAWLHTYRVLTDRRPVAEITISELKEDDLGQYMDVTYKPIKEESALVALIAPDDSEDVEFEQEQTFKLYGDTVHIGGPMVKFNDGLILVNFKTIYKVGKIFSRYNIDNEKEINKTPEMQKKSSYDINGGIDSNWQSVHDKLTENSLRGKIYRIFVDTTQLDVPGQFASNREQTYTLYITNNGFVWDLK